MMNGSKKYFYFLSILINLFFSCKKEKDKTAPRITITAPAENTSYHADDHVRIQAAVTDESNLTAVTVTLVDEYERPAHVTVPVPVSSSLIQVDLLYALDNIHLESGQYKLCVFASDGINDSYAYRSIRIIGIPKVLKKIIVTTAVNPAQTNISFVDSASSSLIPYKNFSGDHLFSATNSYFQKFFHCGKGTGHFLGTDLISDRLLFDLPPVVNPPLPYFTSFYAKNNDYYIGFYNEQIKGFNHMGGVMYTAKLITGYYPLHLIMNDGFLISEELHKINGDKKLVCYYATGVAKQTVDLTQDVVSFCEKNETTVFLFGNKKGQAVIQLYDRAVNNLWNPYPYAIATGSFLCALKLDADTYLLAHSTGTIYKYVFSSGSLTPYLNGYVAVQLIRDEISNTLYVVEKNKINRFDYGNLQALPVIQSAEEILDVGLLFNR